MNGMEVLEIKEKVESKPANVEEVIAAGWKPAEEMYNIAGVDERTWRRFIADVRNATSKKSDSGYDTDFTANLVVKLGSSHKAYYHPKVEKAFQAWLMKNQANQGRASDTIKEATMDNLEIGVAANYVMSSGSKEINMEVLEIKEEKEQGNWYSLEELSQITGYGKDKLNHLLTEASFVQMSKAH